MKDEVRSKRIVRTKGGKKSKEEGRRNYEE